MDLSEKVDSGERLPFLLKKILQSKNLEYIHMEKILNSLDNELRIQHCDVANTCVKYEWLSETMENWKKTEISLPEAEFMCKFIELLSKYNEPFQNLQSTNVLNDLISLLKYDLLKHTPMKIVFIKMLSAIVDHTSGSAWIIASQAWKLVASIYFTNVNLYVEREAMKFFKKLISASKSEDSINEEILSHVFLPLQKNFKTVVEERKLSSNILLFLKLLEIILKKNIFSKSSDFHSKLEKFCNLEIFLKNIIEKSTQEMTLEAALQLEVLFSILKFQDKEKLLSGEYIPAILDTLNILIEQNKFTSIIKLAKYCHNLWNEMRIQMHCKDVTRVNFILIQLLPSLLCVNTPITDREYDLFMKKLFNKKFFQLLGNGIKSSLGSKPDDLAVKGILSVVNNLSSYNIEEATLIFQAMLLIIKLLISDSGYDLETALKRQKKLGSSGIKNRSLLSSVLNGISLLLEKFKINWTELEALGLFKITRCLLKMSDLPYLAVFQTLAVIKVAILNCILPDAESKSIYTNFESLAPIIYERMTDSSWEIRDSCIEVVIAIAELRKSENTGFEQVLLERNFQSLLLNIVENDTESYVRASAIRALTVMTKIEVLNPFLKDQECCLKITKLIDTESEGIVRREAALLIKEIYLTLNDEHSDLINVFYNIMGGAALCDLYWEVKINSLVFWEAVIERIIADQRKTYEPSSHAGCLNKEVINTSIDDMKLELQKSLKKLSKIGCLHVLLTILKEDCDMIVIKKSAEVLYRLLTVLRHYNIIGTEKSPCSTIYRKRKNSNLMEYENNKIPSMTASNSTGCDLLEENISMNFDKSEKIIEDIVNDTDINLLKKVQSQNEETHSCMNSVTLKEIELETFLSQMQGFDKDLFLENKQKSFMNVEGDLALTMNEINIEHSVNEINIMDCY